ncbi:MAG: sigma-54-dependent Fis family transcriptional regulator [Candidatus Marinimicrobia bacterium CG08_land_8_20_14_0_20_45_22]|nr:MAG: sigma-54-dependent Fis family transcriptional regulator [Candidatus Marinimicrobia bacterium CG08_land_8_20_14_0_20_45_22]
MIKNTIRLLLIEDEAFDVRRIQNTLKPYERIIISDIVSSGGDALKLIAQNDYDVVVMDFQIAGGIMGEELIREIRKLNATVQIIAITKMTIYQTNFDFANRLIRAGAFWFCTKYPVDIENFIYQPTDFILSIVNAYEKRRLEIDREHSKNKLSRTVSDILSRKVIIGVSSAIQELREQIRKYADANANVLIYGKSGTGKELVATNIHYLSSRKLENFVPINCGGIPRELIESELFGFEKGSFTGAQDSRSGLFEQANNGTIFLDEVSEFPLSAQSKLLRVLQDGQIEKIGRKQRYEVDVRVISATNKDLEKMVSDKEFREDLFYRLNVLQIYVPTLQERPEDIPVLADHYLRRYCHGLGRAVPEFEPGVMDVLTDFSWPGNVRQLQNTLQRMIFLSSEESISKKTVLVSIGAKNFQPDMRVTYRFDKNQILPLTEIERQFRKNYMQFVRENSKTDAEAAKKLGLAPPNYYRISKELGMK